MTTFQAIVYGIIRGFTEFLPIAPGAHDILTPYFLGWPAPSGVLAGVLALGTLLAVLIYFIHDWASMISSFLQVVIYRKRPMTLDERLPFFLMVSTLPPAIAWYYIQGETFSENLLDPKWAALSLAVFVVPLLFSDSMSRKNKGMFDWNGWDALIIGIGQLLMFVPGAGRVIGAMSAGMFRNYNREAIAKFTFFASAPILAASAAFHLKELSFHGSEAMPGVSWVTLAVAFLVSLFTGLLAIGGLMRHIQRKGFKEYMIYRVLLAVAFGIVFWMRSRSGA